MLIIDFVTVVVDMNQVPTKSINECWYNQQQTQLLHAQFLGSAHYYSVKRSSQLSNTCFQFLILKRTQKDCVFSPKWHGYGWKNDINSDYFIPQPSAFHTIFLLLL